MDAEAAAVAKSGSPFKPRDRDSSDPTKVLQTSLKACPSVPSLECHPAAEVCQQSNGCLGKGKPLIIE